MVLALQTALRVGASSRFQRGRHSITRVGARSGRLMLAGRVGAAMAAEIGTMRVTEQIDALRTLSTNPFKYLIAPRLIAAVLMLPVLVGIADIIGVFGGYLVSIYNWASIPRPTSATLDFVETLDVVRPLAPRCSGSGHADGLLSRLQPRGGAQGVGGHHNAGLRLDPHPDLRLSSPSCSSRNECQPSLVVLNPEAETQRNHRG
jgi:hypothetical protein